ncbi:pirin family protein [Colwellia chukchiensis]|nr:pirin family protein [Colwellia chukchiensis]
MMKATTIKQMVQGMPASDGAGVKLKRIIGQPMLKRLDPFLMLDEFGSDDAQDYLAGFPPHPHRGFQTVTYMLNGKMGHKDSVGNQGIIEDGGLQWMNAGKGIIHEEMPKQTAGLMRGFQLWVNLPAREKMSEPGYQDIKSAEIKEVSLGPDSKARVLAGQLKGVQGAVSTQAVHPQFYDIHVGSKQSINIDVNETHNGFVYVYEGSMMLGDKAINQGQLAVLALGSQLTVMAEAQTKFIFVSGKPIAEPVEQYGPFVMNTRAEIEQAIEDYQQNRFVD